MTALREAALDYALRGFAVFPCGNDKAPLIEGGFKSASADMAQVDVWWHDHPDALIGMPVPEGTVVIDMDPRNGGRDSLARLFREHGRFPATRRARTRSGGMHYHFAFTPEEGARFRKQLADGVDVRAPGKGYVIVPPSPGYTWADEREPAELPEWVAEVIVKPEPEHVTVGVESAPRYFPFEEGTAYGLAARERELGKLATAREGTRNDALNAAAFQLAQLVAGGELDGDSTQAQLAEVADRIGLDPFEVGGTLRSGWEAGLREPRNAPEREPEEPVRASRVTLPDEEHFWTDWLIDEPPPPFYLDPLLPKNAYVLVYGATEAAKSMAWVAILADGSRNGVKSTVYSLENPRHVDRDRLRRLSPDPCCFRITHEPLDLGHPEQVEALIERERQWGTNVVLIDTYSHAFNSRMGDGDGNARAIAFAQQVRHVMHELNDQGLSVVVIDHTGFPKEGDVKEPRDASAKRQQVDVAIFMEKDGEWTPGSDRAGFSMTNFKAARFGNPFSNVRGAIRGRKGDPLRLEWADTDFASRWSQ